MIVRTQKRIEFKNECNCIVDLVELEKSVIWIQSKPTARLKKIYMHGRYPAVSVHNKKIHVHRLLASYWERRQLERYEYVNHINGDKLDSSRHNLEILSASIHQSITNKGRKQDPSHVIKRINASCLTRYGTPYLPKPLNY